MKTICLCLIACTLLGCQKSTPDADRLLYVTVSSDQDGTIFYTRVNPLEVTVIGERGENRDHVRTDGITYKRNYIQAVYSRNAQREWMVASAGPVYSRERSKRRWMPLLRPRGEEIAAYLTSFSPSGLIVASSGPVNPGALKRDSPLLLVSNDGSLREHITITRNVTSDNSGAVFLTPMGELWHDTLRSDKATRLLSSVEAARLTMDHDGRERYAIDVIGDQVVWLGPTYLMLTQGTKVKDTLSLSDGRPFYLGRTQRFILAIEAKAKDIFIRYRPILGGTWQRRLLTRLDERLSSAQMRTVENRHVVSLKTLGKTYPVYLEEKQGSLSYKILPAFAHGVGGDRLTATMTRDRFAAVNGQGNVITIPLPID